MSNPVSKSEAADPPTHLIYMTVGTRAEAMKIATEVVQEKLAACANVLSGVTSIYEWEGVLQQEEECVVILKTQERRVSFLTDRLVQLHSYECPCVVSMPLSDGNPQFFDWVRAQTT